jgi:hypothetical protein
MKKYIKKIESIRSDSVQNIMRTFQDLRENKF